MMSVMLRFVVIIKCVGIVLAASIGSNDLTDFSDVTEIGPNGYVTNSDSELDLTVITDPTEDIKTENDKTERFKKNTKDFLSDPGFMDEQKSFKDIVRLRQVVNDKPFSDKGTEVNIPVAVIIEAHPIDVSYNARTENDSRQINISNSPVKTSSTRINNFGRGASFSSTGKERNTPIEIQTEKNSKYIPSLPVSDRSTDYKNTEKYDSDLLKKGTENFAERPSEYTVTTNIPSYTIPVEIVYDNFKNKRQEPEFIIPDLGSTSTFYIQQQKYDYVTTTTVKPHYKSSRGHIKYGDTVKLSFNEITDDRNEIPFVENVFRSRNFTRANDSVLKLDAPRRPDIKYIQPIERVNTQILNNPATKKYNVTEFGDHKVRFMLNDASLTPNPKIVRRGDRKHKKGKIISTKQTVNDLITNNITIYQKKIINEFNENDKAKPVSNNETSEYNINKHTILKTPVTLTFSTTQNSHQLKTDNAQPTQKYAELNTTANIMESRKKYPLETIDPFGQTTKTETNVTNVNITSSTITDEITPNSFQYSLQGNDTNSESEVYVTQRPLRTYSANLAGFIRTENNLASPLNQNNKVDKLNQQLMNVSIQHNQESNNDGKEESNEGNKILTSMITNQVKNKSQHNLNFENNNKILGLDLLLNSYYSQETINATTEYSFENTDYHSTTEINFQGTIPEMNVFADTQINNDIKIQLNETSRSNLEISNKSVNIIKKDRNINKIDEIIQEQEVITPNTKFTPKIVRVYGKRIITTPVIADHFESNKKEIINMNVDALHTNNKTELIESEKMSNNMIEISKKNIEGEVSTESIANTTESLDEVTINFTNEPLGLMTQFTNLHSADTTTPDYKEQNRELYQTIEPLISSSAGIDDMQYSNNLFKPLQTEWNMQNNYDTEINNIETTDVYFSSRENILTEFETTTQFNLQYIQVSTSKSDLNASTKIYSEYNFHNESEGTFISNISTYPNATEIVTPNLTLSQTTESNESKLSKIQQFGMVHSVNDQLSGVENTIHYNEQYRKDDSITEPDIEITTIPSNEQLEILTTVFQYDYASGHDDDELIAVTSDTNTTSEFPLTTLGIINEYTSNTESTNKLLNPELQYSATALNISKPNSFYQKENNEIQKKLSLRTDSNDMSAVIQYNKQVIENEKTIESKLTNEQYIDMEDIYTEMAGTLPQTTRSDFTLIDSIEINNREPPQQSQNMWSLFTKNSDGNKSVSDIFLNNSKVPISLAEDKTERQNKEITQYPGFTTKSTIETFLKQEISSYSSPNLGNKIIEMKSIAEKNKNVSLISAVENNTKAGPSKNIGIPMQQTKNITHQELPLNLFSNIGITGNIPRIEDLPKWEENTKSTTSFPEILGNEYAQIGFTAIKNPLHDLPLNMLPPVENKQTPINKLESINHQINLDFKIKTLSVKETQAAEITNSTFNLTSSHEYTPVHSAETNNSKLQDLPLNLLPPVSNKINEANEQINYENKINNPVVEINKLEHNTLFLTPRNYNISVDYIEMKSIPTQYESSNLMAPVVNESKTTDSRNQIEDITKLKDNVSVLLQNSINKSIAASIESTKIENMSLSLLPPISNTTYTKTAKFDDISHNLKMDGHEDIIRDKIENKSSQEEEIIHVIIISSNDSVETISNNGTMYLKDNKATNVANVVREEPTLKTKSKTRGPVVLILNSDIQVYSQNGRFLYSYENADGSRAYENGELKKIDEEHAGEAVSGGFSFNDKEGHNYAIEYTADENGYRPVGDHLPTPPPIPPAIARALAYLATKSTPASTTESLDIK